MTSNRRPLTLQSCSIYWNCIKFYKPWLTTKVSSLLPTVASQSSPLLIRIHSEFVDDDTQQFFLPAYVPPVPMLLPWAIGGCSRLIASQSAADEDTDRAQSVSRVSKGSLLAHRLASKIVTGYPALDKKVVINFYKIIYENLKSKLNAMLPRRYVLDVESFFSANEVEVKQLVVQELSKIYTYQLPGSMILLNTLVKNAGDVIHSIYNPQSRFFVGAQNVCENVDYLMSASILEFCFEGQK